MSESIYRRLRDAINSALPEYEEPKALARARKKNNKRAVMRLELEERENAAARFALAPLPEGFDPGEEPGYIPGRADGLWYYGIEDEVAADYAADTAVTEAASANSTALSDRTRAALAKLVITASSRREDERESAFSLLPPLVSSCPAPLLFEGVQKAVYEQRESVDPQRLRDFASALLRDSADPAEVKAALGIIGSYVAEPDYRLKSIIRTLGKYPEFTQYAVRLMRGWKGTLAPTGRARIVGAGGDEILSLGRLTYGWGKVFCAEFLDPADCGSPVKSAEAADWLLCEGYDNGIDISLTALGCLRKSGAASLLEKPKRFRGQRTRPALIGISRMLTALAGVGDDSARDALDDLPDCRGFVLGYLGIFRAVPSLAALPECAAALSVLAGYFSGDAEIFAAVRPFI